MEITCAVVCYFWKYCPRIYSTNQRGVSANVRREDMLCVYYVKEMRPWNCHYLRWRTGWRSAGGGEIRSKRGKQFCEETNKARNSWPHKERTAICELMLQKKKSYYHPSCRETKMFPNSVSLFVVHLFLSHLLFSGLFLRHLHRDLPGAEIDFKSEPFSSISTVTLDCIFGRMCSCIN